LYRFGAAASEYRARRTPASLSPLPRCRHSTPQPLRKKLTEQHDKVLQLPYYYYNYYYNKASKRILYFLCEQRINTQYFSNMLHWQIFGHFWQKHWLLQGYFLDEIICMYEYLI
jgi:hypothetical protein